MTEQISAHIVLNRSAHNMSKIVNAIEQAKIEHIQT